MRCPNATPDAHVKLVLDLRRATKWVPARLAAALRDKHNLNLSPATMHRILVRNGLSRVRDLDPPTGELARTLKRWFSGTLAREWAYVRTYSTEAERVEALGHFIRYYNHERLHSALGHKPPQPLSLTPTWCDTTPSQPR
jgi:Integrase core domain